MDFILVNKWFFSGVTLAHTTEKGQAFNEEKPSKFTPEWSLAYICENRTRLLQLFSNSANQSLTTISAHHQYFLHFYFALNEPSLSI